MPLKEVKNVIVFIIRDEEKVSGIHTKNTQVFFSLFSSQRKTICKQSHEGITAVF